MRTRLHVSVLLIPFDWPMIVGILSAQPLQSSSATGATCRPVGLLPHCLFHPHFMSTIVVPCFWQALVQKLMRADIGGHMGHA